LGSLAFSGLCKAEEITTNAETITTFIPTLLEKNEPIFITEIPTPKVSVKIDEDAHKKLQKIANITIAQFLNNKTRNTLTLAEIMELRELGDSIMEPNFMLPNLFGKTNKTMLSKISIPSTTMLNLGSAILKSNFMPPAFLKPFDLPAKNETIDEKLKDNSTSPVVLNATIDVALSTMTFHR